MLSELFITAITIVIWVTFMVVVNYFGEAWVKRCELREKQKLQRLIDYHKQALLGRKK